jgi:hypothetical protein
VTATPVSVADYLASPEAVREVEALIAKGGRIALSLDPAPGGRCWTAHDLGAWRRVVFRPGWGDEGEIVAYYRQWQGGTDEEVSDCGEALRALRLRLGFTRIPGPILRRMRKAADVGDCWSPLIKDGCLVQYTHSCDELTLPRVLCRVLLASYRVSRLEVP